MSILAMGLTQPPVQLVSGAIFVGQSRWGVKLTTHLHQVLRLRMSGAMLLLLHAFMACIGTSVLVLLSFISVVPLCAIVFPKLEN